MGLDVNGTKFLLFAKARGVRFDHTVTMGRQGLYLTDEAFAKNLAAFGHPDGTDVARRLLAEDKGYAEPFLRFLGAQQVRSVDASGYEGATDVQDLNRGISGMPSTFTAVIDAGTLEHVFNFPTALRSCMELVAPGGHFISITPANNFLGHGFYQFSPELYFRVFGAGSGFVLDHVILFEDIPDAEWFAVTDPDVVKSRVTLVNTQPTYLAVIARRVDAAPALASWPQQSDYVALWRESQSQTGQARPAPAARGPLRRLVHELYRRTPDVIRRAVYRRMRHLADQRFSNERFYKRIDVS